MVSYKVISAEAFNIALAIEEDAQGLRRSREAGHTDNISGNGHKHLRSRIDYQILDVEIESFRHTIDLRILRERVLGFGNAYREASEAKGFCSGNLFQRL